MVRYFRNLSNIDDRVRNISWQTLNLTQTLTLTLTQTLTLILTLILTLTPTLTIYIHIHIHGHLGLTGCRNSVCFFNLKLSVRHLADVAMTTSFCWFYPQNRMSVAASGTAGWANAGLCHSRIYSFLLVRFASVLFLTPNQQCQSTE